MSALLASVGFYWIGRSFLVDGQLRFGNPVNAVALERDLDPEPRQVRAEITRVQGSPVASEGDKCDFLVERRPRDPNSFYCNAQIVCGGRLVYGGPNRGYFPCKLYSDGRRDVVGSDPSTTGADQDAAIQLNTREGIMRIWDDEHGSLGKFALEAEILSVQ